MIELTLIYNPELSDRGNFAAFINENFGTRLTADDVKDLMPMTVDGGEYNTEVTIDLEAGGEQIITYNRVDINTLVETDFLVGVDNPALLRKALESQFGIIVGPRDLGINASKRAQGLLGVTLAGTLCINGEKTFKLRPTLAKALRPVIGDVQMFPVGACKDVPFDIDALPYLTVIKATDGEPVFFKDIDKGTVLTEETFDGLAYEFTDVSLVHDQPVLRYGVDTLSSNFVLRAIVAYGESMSGEFHLAFGIGDKEVRIQFGDDFMAFGNATYPPVHQTRLVVDCIGQAGSNDVTFLINGKLVGVTHLSELPKGKPGLKVLTFGVSDFQLFEAGVKRF